jgi:ABC-type sugar transport system ATPase subunit
LTADGPAIVARPRDAGFVPGTTVEIGIRPDAFTLVDRGGLEARVVLVERLGGSSLVHARVEGAANAITVALSGTYEGPANTPIRIGIDAKRVHVFGDDGRSI